MSIPEKYRRRHRHLTWYERRAQDRLRFEATEPVRDWLDFVVWCLGFLANIPPFRWLRWP
jgi:hypothetical protein